MFKQALLLIGLCVIVPMFSAEETVTENWYTNCMSILGEVKGQLSSIQEPAEALVLGTNLVYCIVNLPSIIVDCCLGTKAKITNTIVAVSYLLLAVRCAKGNLLYSCTASKLLHCFVAYLEMCGISSLARNAALGNYMISHGEAKP